MKTMKTIQILFLLLMLITYAYPEDLVQKICGMNAKDLGYYNNCLKANLPSTTLDKMHDLARYFEFNDRDDIFMKFICEKINNAKEELMKKVNEELLLDIFNDHCYKQVCVNSSASLHINTEKVIFLIIISLIYIMKYF